MINVSAPINSLSLGQITFGILNEFYNRDIKTCVFPKGGQLDLSAYNNAGSKFQQNLKYSVEEAPKTYSRDNPGLAVWHINHSWDKSSRNNFLLTFHELDSITDNERAILNSFNKVFVTSKFTKEVFEDGGVKVPVIFVPMGIDDVHFNIKNKNYYDPSVTSWAIIGKLEKRKGHKKAIQGWIKKFGGNPSHRLHLLIHNPFFTPDQMNQAFADVFNNQQPPPNVILYPPQQTNTLVNDLFNASDIVIDMSGGEALSLPSLNMVALGKHALIHNCTAMSDWANSETAILVESTGKEPVFDGIFFHPNGAFNQGNIFTWNENDYLNGLDKVLARKLANKINTKGLELKEKYSFKNGVDIILSEMGYQGEVISEIKNG